MATPRDKQQATDTATASPSSLFFPHRLVSVPIPLCRRLATFHPFLLTFTAGLLYISQLKPSLVYAHIPSLETDMSIPVVSARTQGQIVLYFDRKTTVPTLPYELHEHITADAWASRIPQLIRVSNRYNRPALEGLWFIVMFIATIAVPAGLHDVIFDSLHKKMPRNDAKYETRVVQFAIAASILLLFTAPHMIWKYMGQKRATDLVKQWEAEDARGRSPGSFCPVWSVRLAGYLSSSTRLVVTTPYKATASNFHPAAYMPSWINGPADSGPPRGIPPTYLGYQQAAMYGDVPIYGVPGGGPGLPPYVGDDGRAYSDEKVDLDGPRV